MDPKNAIKGGSFCPLPWTGFIMYPNGEVKNCVLSETVLGNINNTDIEGVLQGEQNTQIKQCMNSHQKHPGCMHCHKHEKDSNSYNIRSDRYYYLKSLSKVPYSTYDTNDTSLHTVDMRWRNTCNLACVYCVPELSSTWEKELGVNITVDEKQLAKTKKYVLENAPNLKNVYLAGGEPLLMKENVELLDRLDPSCEVRINTNLTNLKSPVYERASKFRNVHWTVSVETMAEEFEYIRYGAKWNVFLENLQTVAQLDHRISFNMLWFVLNPYTVFDTVDYLTSLGHNENSFVIGPITGPSVFDIRNCNDNVLYDMHRILAKRKKSASSRYLLHNSYHNMLEHISLPFERKTQHTIQHLKDIDLRRGIDHTKIFDIQRLL
jgi:radical SAM protein with 4Fe4S-binding SPASM domain